MKKTDSITIRCSPELKAQLEAVAKDKRWSLSQTVCIILEEHFEKVSLRDD